MAKKNHKSNFYSSLSVSFVVMYFRDVIIFLAWEKQFVNFMNSDLEEHLPNIFVSAVGNEIKGGEVTMHREQVQTQQHDQHFNDDPHEGSAGT